MAPTTLILLFSLAVTLGAVLASSMAAAVVSSFLRGRTLRRRAEARADEVALLAAAAQRWRMTPAAWGGPQADGFAGVSFDALGLPTVPRRADRRQTANGVYQIVHVPSCPTLDRAARRTGQETGRDGLLVVGWDPETGDDTAVVVLGPLVQVPLASVPWAWIAELSRPAASASVAPSARPAERRSPSRPTVAADRAVQAPVQPLRLVSWPLPPEADVPTADATDGGAADESPPPVRPRWRRAA